MLVRANPKWSSTPVPPQLRRPAGELSPTLEPAIWLTGKGPSISHSAGNSIENSVSPFRFRICIVSARVR
jgi:hypothetical protein